MTDGRSRDDFVQFIDYLGDKGLVPGATAASRKATANTVLSVLSSEEADDVTGIDLDEVMHRFHNLRGQSYSPDSIQTYRSRLRTALSDFSAYLENPLSFRPSGQGRTRTRSGGVEATKSRQDTSPARQPSVTVGTVSARPAALPVHVTPIAVRPDLTVHVSGLPFDLTRVEAQRIANIILAHAAAE